MSGGCRVRHAVVNAEPPCAGSSRRVDRRHRARAPADRRARRARAATASSAPSSTTSTRPSGRLRARAGQPGRRGQLRARTSGSRRPARRRTPARPTRRVMTAAGGSATARPRLALRAAVARPVHERLPPDRRPAPRAGPVGLAVDGEEAREVAALPVDVDVEGVEGGAALRQRLPQHVADAVEQVGDLGAGELVGGAGAVQPRPPQRLVGVDVADAADQGLVEQRPLDLGAAPAQRGAEGRLRRRSRPAGRSRCAPAGAGISARRALLHREAAEGALVDEAQLAAAVGEGEPGAQVRLVGLASASPRAAGRSCRGGRRAPGPTAAPSGSATGSQRYLPRRWAAVNVRPVSAATKCSAPSRCRRTARGWCTSTAATVRPATHCSRPRRTTSTSGSSGTAAQLLGRGVRQAASAASCSAAFLVRPAPRP